MQKKWKCEDGILFFYPESSSWSFKTTSRIITVIAWCQTAKGPMLEVTIQTKKKEKKKAKLKVIFEILQKNFDIDFYAPQDLDSSAKTVMALCTRMCKLDIDSYDLISYSKELLECFDNFKSIHIYNGIGEFCGIRKTIFGIKILKSVPCSCLIYPGTRLDSHD